MTELLQPIAHTYFNHDSHRPQTENLDSNDDSDG
jgi:hypothetical protein